MTRQFLFALAVTALWTAAAPFAAATAADAAESQAQMLAAYSLPDQPVSLKPAALVETPLVHLGDLFDGLGEEGGAPVARAPAPGKRVTLDARWLQSLARSYNLPWRPRSALESIVVERASQVIDRSRVEEVLRQALRDEGVDGDIELLLDTSDPRLHMPTDAEDSLRLVRWSLNRETGRFSAQLAAPAEGAAVAQLSVSGRAVTMTEVPVPARRLAKDEVIAAADLDWIRVRTDRIARNVVTDPDELIGKSARRGLREGQQVRSADLRRPVVIGKNNLVTIRLETDKMVLTVQGRALEDGAQNQVIRVMNTQSNVVVNAQVVKSGVVAVSRAGDQAISYN